MYHPGKVRSAERLPRFKSVTLCHMEGPPSWDGTGLENQDGYGLHLEGSTPCLSAWYVKQSVAVRIMKAKPPPPAVCHWFMETTRNSRCITEPLPEQPKLGKRRRRDKRYCHVNKAEHLYTRLGALGRWWHIVICKFCGHKEFRNNKDYPLSEP